MSYPLWWSIKNHEMNLHLCKKGLRGENGRPAKQSLESQHNFQRNVSLILKHMSIVIGPLWLHP